MTELFLIRHCEAYGNIYRRLDGVRDTGVTALGLKQIRYLSRRFERERLDAVYSSALTRARRTAQGICEVTGAPQKCCAALHERDMGVFDGKSWYEAAAAYPEVFAAWQADMDHYILPGGESAAGAGLRFREALLSVCRENPDSRIAVVAHSMVIKALLESISAGPVPFGNNTAVSLLHADGEQGLFTIQYLNDDSHLPAEMQTSRQRWFKQGADLRNYSLRYGYSLPDGVQSPFMPQIGDGERTHLDAYENDVLVGYAEFHFEGLRCLVDALFIREDLRRLGFATQLIGEMLYRAEGRGCSSLLLAAPRADESVTALAAKNGFEPAGKGWHKAV